jgi:ectoine hydroxylase-related dioxygenase (phytanoyl-CoA dioxygenase family)
MADVRAGEVRTNEMVTPEQLHQFRDQGFFITEPLFDDATLDALIAECERVRAATEERLSSSDREGINLRGKRYFLAKLHEQSDLCREVCARGPLVPMAVDLLGPEVRLYWNQAVIKPPRQGASFAWHQDTGYVPIEPEEYLTCWLALDDTTLENGCIRVIPGSHHWGLQPHRRDETIGDMVGYEGPDEGLPVPIRRGQAIMFSSLTLHCSGPNTSNGSRRAYVIQYCPTHAVNPRSGEPWGDDLVVASEGKPLFPPLGTSNEP